MKYISNVESLMEAYRKEVHLLHIHNASWMKFCEDILYSRHKKLRFNQSEINTEDDELYPWWLEQYNRELLPILGNSGMYVSEWVEKYVRDNLSLYGLKAKEVNNFMSLQHKYNGCKPNIDGKFTFFFTLFEKVHLIEEARIALSKIKNVRKEDLSSILGKCMYKAIKNTDTYHNHILSI